MTNIRIYHWARRTYLRGMPIAPRLLGRATRMVYSCEIPYTADIHPTVIFAHKGLGVVSAHDVRVGADTRIVQHVTMGGRSGVRASPVIGEGVLIGAGACILGGISVGDGSVVAANSVVPGDVPPGVMVAGAPAAVKGVIDGM